jgi:radical SAM protein with 4Fe4S-binding SPASM domain
MCLRLRGWWSIISLILLNIIFESCSRDMLKEKIKSFRESLSAQELKLISPGLYHYLFASNSSKSRVHLRIEDEGTGTLIIDASRVVHLNQMATLMAYMILEGLTPNLAIKHLTRRYKIEQERAINDYAQLSQTINELIKPDGACPIHELDIETTTPFSQLPSAPYRMDLAITYRCNNDCTHCYNARERTHPELTTADWKNIIDRLWNLSIPHIVFTGGEPTLRSDLVELITYAETKGLITGLNTNGRRLADKSFVTDLVNGGLDHVQITLESHNPNIHDGMVNKYNAWKQTVNGIQNVLETPLYVMTNTTMLQNNSPYLADTLDYLSQLGVPTIGLNALIHAGRGKAINSGLDETALFPLLEMAREYTSRNNQKLIWYTPTQYCNFDPMQLDLGVKGCTAALYNMCIESDGNVIPCQSYYEILGNILFDEWDSIWNHDLSIRLRERKKIPPECNDCVLLKECGGGCPLMFDTI